VKTTRGPRSSRSVRTPIASAGALDGIGAGAGLVQQHEAARGRGARDRREVRRVRGERREVALDRLRVADVGEHRAEAGEPRALGRVHEAARLREQRREPRVLSATVLPPAFGPVTASPRWPSRSTTSIGTTRRSVSSSSGWRTARSSTSLVPSVGASRDGRARTPRSPRARRSARAPFERGQRVGIHADEVRQLLADAALLGFLGLRGEEQAVVELDREERLDEDGAVGRGAVLHDAGERPRRPPRGSARRSGRSVR
jgi:hypothetical protein